MSLNYILDLEPFNNEPDEWVNLLANNIRCKNLKADTMEISTNSSINTRGITNIGEIKNTGPINNTGRITTSDLTVNDKITTKNLDVTETIHTKNLAVTKTIDTVDINFSGLVSSVEGIVSVGGVTTVNMRSSNGYFFGSSTSETFRLRTYYEFINNSTNIMGFKIPNSGRVSFKRIGNTTTLTLTCTDTSGIFNIPTASQPLINIPLASLGTTIKNVLLSDLKTRTQPRGICNVRVIINPLPIITEYKTGYLTIEASSELIEIKLENNIAFTDLMDITEFSISYQNFK